MKITSAAPEVAPPLRPSAASTVGAGAFSQMLQSVPHYGQHAASFGEFGMFGRFDAVASPEIAVSSPSVGSSPLVDAAAVAVAPDHVAETPPQQATQTGPAFIGSRLLAAPSITPLVQPQIVGRGSPLMTAPAGRPPGEASVSADARDRASAPRPVPTRTARAASDVAIAVSTEASGLNVVAAGYLSAARTLELRRAIEQLARDSGYGLTQFTLNGALVNPATVGQLGVAHGYRPR